MSANSDIVWLDNLTPKSTRFDDSYYSQAGGLDETRYVFLEGNELPRRWSAGASPVIGELGFGTGLNFLASWVSFRNCLSVLEDAGEDKSAGLKDVGLGADILNEDNQNGQSSNVLTFLSFEKYPMSADALAKALSCWGDLGDCRDVLVDAWQEIDVGWNFFDFGEARLHLFIGDAADGISAMPLPVDAWFLDGFNPKTNPELWSLDLMRAVYAGSSSDATFASYTAAGWVRRNLQSAGFEVMKRKGFGHKRDMIVGRKIHSSTVSGDF